ncbi:MAG: TonB-dependent receptor [Ignavibacteriales bacterium]|nr:TonB-dependent receptor [Ignavibacteriales bacterium]
MNRSSINTGYVRNERALEKLDRNVKLMKSSFCLLFLFAFSHLHAQPGSILGVVRDSETNEAVVGATIRVVGTSTGTSTSLNGSFLISGVPSGNVKLRISHVAYLESQLEVHLTSNDTAHIEILLRSSEIEESEVVVTGTRTMHNIADVPVRIEVIPLEEIEEKVLMTPSSVAMLLNESTGARVQTTSSTSGALNLRIQGLSGRYTQILFDGIPSFGGMAGGFGLTQLVPLNLRQVEIVKGAGSALYGADAIAGIVNFLTKEPREDFELSALVNGTTQNGFDAGAFAGQKLDELGFTIYVSRNTQKRFDVDGDNFADIPEYDKISVAPKIMYRFNENLQGSISFAYLAEERIGGVQNAQRISLGAFAPYLEQVRTTRWDVSSRLQWTLNEENSVQLKAAAMNLRRNDVFGNLPFSAVQTVFHGEAEFLTQQGSHAILMGTVLHVDDLTDRTTGSQTSTSYTFNAPGIMVQDEIRLSEQWTALLSGRTDFHNRFGTFFTPRGSVMYKISPGITLRLGGGGGFKAPTAFVEESEELGFRKTRLSIGLNAEKAKSASFDMNWRTIMERVSVTTNCAIYATWIDNAVIADEDSLMNQVVFLRNATGLTFTRGGEVQLKIAYDDFKLTAGYTYTYATRNDRGEKEELELNPRHSFGVVAMWENHEMGWKVGWESYWTGTQKLERNPFRRSSPAYWNSGLIGEKSFGQFRIFVNFENIFDARQTRFERIVTGNPESGSFDKLPIYAPLEGRVINGGMRAVL